VKEKLLKLVEQTEKNRRRLCRLVKKSPGPGEEKQIAQAFSVFQANIEELTSALKAAVGRDRQLPGNLARSLFAIGRELKQKLELAAKHPEDLTRESTKIFAEQKRLLALLEDEIRNRWPSPLRIKILGIGEITTTIELVGEGALRRKNPESGQWVSLAVKKAPSFPTRSEAEKYQSLCCEYEQFLSAKLGIKTPFAEHKLMPGKNGRWLVYNLQERLPSESIACLLIQVASQEMIEQIFLRLLQEMRKIFIWNHSHPEYLLGFDGQIPNWAFPRFGPQHPVIAENEPLLYIDTTTPLVRREGKEQLDTEIFIKSIPLVLRPIVRRTLLQQVLDRYYRPRDVMLDLIASFITHHRRDLVSSLVELANQWMAKELPELGLEPFSEKEILSYNRQDVMIWKFFRQMKRMDRFLTEKILGKSYEQRLPAGSPRSWENLVGAGGRGLTVPESLKPLLRRKPG